MLLPPDVAGGICHAPDDAIEQPQDAEAVPLAEFLGPLQAFEQMMREKPVANMRALERRLGWAGCRQDDATPSADPIQLAFDGLDIARHRGDFERLGTHAAGEAAVEDNQKPLRRNACAPFAERIQGDRRVYEVVRIGVMRDQLVRLGSVAREGDDHHVLLVAHGESLEGFADGGDGRPFVGEQGGLATERVGEERVKRHCVASRETEPADFRGGVAVDADEQALERHTVPQSPPPGDVSISQEPTRPG